MANTGGLTGDVINIRNNQPIEGAAVNLSGPVTESTKTDSNGKFTFNSLPPANNYSLDVSASGYESEHYEDIVVIENNVTDLQKLALMPQY